MENQKVELLIKENQNMRSEQIMISKTVHSCVFSFLASFGFFILAILNLYGRNAVLNASQIGILAFCISQVQFFLVFYVILLTSDATAKAAYMSYLENEINAIVGESIIFWESKIVPRQQKVGILFFSELVLGIFYSGVFGTLIYYSYGVSTCNWYFWAQTLEAVVVMLFILLLFGEPFRFAKYIMSVRNNNELQNVKASQIGEERE